MKRTSFLHKLCQEGKLSEIEPSEEIKAAYLQKSAKSLSSAKALYSIGNLEDSVALAYYAMYHCLLALLFRVGIKCENHTAAIILLKRVFGIDNGAISGAKSERVDKQYYVDFKVTELETSESIRIAEEFVADLTDFIEKLTEDKVSEYRNNALKLMKE